ncbi:MAG: hypothetical protein QOE77_1647 [Blastocatellia bacterium]|jgi:hypothetical protein|nr:hypothetical protein [Blastocatellia bacterium]
MLKILLTTLALTLFSAPTIGRQNPNAIFASADAFVKSISKSGQTLGMEARGDLNGDNLADWVGVIHSERTEDSAATDQLYVLLQIAAGGYRLAAQSQKAEIPGMGCCWLEALSISNGGIYVQDNAKTGVTIEAANHQFKLYKGQWRLVGLKVYYSDLRPESQPDTDTDMNFLTGSVIETKTKENKKPVIKRSRKRFATYLLKDFDFSTGFGLEQTEP